MPNASGNIDNHILELAVEFLKKFSDDALEYGYYEWIWPHHWTLEQRRAFYEMDTENEPWDNDNSHLDDWQVAHILSKILKDLAK